MNIITTISSLILDDTQGSNIIESGGLRLDTTTQRLTANGRTVDLRPKSWDLLKYMVSRPGVLLPKADLLKAVWGNRVVTEASLNQAVRELRKALGDDAKSPRYIETVHRRGFRFIAGTEHDGSSQTQSATQSTAAGHGRSKLFGRDGELVQLRELLKHAEEGRRQLCFVTGEPGIGKTSLVEAFLDSLPHGEVSKVPLVGQGQCIDQHGEGEAYLPILEALDRLARGPKGEQVRQQLGRYAPSWLQQIPWLQPPDGPSFDPQIAAATPTRMLREFCVLCESIAAESPLILWLEDLHWSDHSTIGLLEALARRQESAQILVVASYRPVDAALLNAPIRELKQTMVQHHRATELPLELLTMKGVRDYLEDRFEGLAQLPELTEVIFETTDGNPLFVVTLANYLVAKQLLVCDRNHWRAAQSLESIREQSPVSLKDIVEEQLSRLTDEELSLLETASVVGVTFSARAVANISAGDTNAVELACDRLTKASQLLLTKEAVEWPDKSVSQGYEFVHNIFRRILYDSLSPARLQRLHLCAGDALSKAYRGQEGEVAGELALHFEVGHDPARATTYLLLAAQRALRLGPASESALYLERALVQVASLPADTKALQLELDLRLSMLRGMAYSWKDNTPEKKRENLQRALVLCNELKDEASKTLLLSLQIGSQVLAGNMNDAEQSVSIFRETSKNVENAVLLSLEPMWSGVRDLVLGKLHNAEEHFTRCIAMLAEEGLREPTSLFNLDPTLASLGYSTISIWLLGFPDEARRRAQLCRSRAEAIGSPLAQVNALDAALNVEHLQEELEAARPRAAALDACLEEYGIEYNFSRPMAARNWILLSSGEARAAMAGMERDISEARESGHGIFLSLMQNTLAEACLVANAAPEGMEAIEQAIQIAQGGERVFEAESWRLKGEFLRAKGDAEQAEHCFRTALAVAAEQSALSLELRSA
ncbi:MAG: AAA family ATPase, partial [Halieaceae bacterium]